MAAAVVFLAALHVRLKIFCTLRMPLIEGCQPSIEGLNWCVKTVMCVYVWNGGHVTVLHGGVV